MAPKREEGVKELQLMKVQEWSGFSCWGRMEMRMSCDLHISQSAHSLCLCACLLALVLVQVYETVISLVVFGNQQPFHPLTKVINTNGLDQNVINNEVVAI